MCIVNFEFHLFVYVELERTSEVASIVYSLWNLSARACYVRGVFVQRENSLNENVTSVDLGKTRSRNIIIMCACICYGRGKFMAKAREIKFSQFRVLSRLTQSIIGINFMCTIV